MLKISERKNTTKKGLKELETLIKSFEGKFEEDIDDVFSPTFYGKIRVDNNLYSSDFNYRNWENFSARWAIKDGYLEIQSIGEDAEPHKYHEINIVDFKQINFSEAITALEKVLARYNTETEKKDAQIENFLKFCADFKTAK